MQHLFALLNSKITKPGYPPGTVARLQLFRLLNHWPEWRAIAIYAPAGYGKSSLASQWIDWSPAAQQVAWLTLDENDCDPIHFAHSFAAALERVLPGALSLTRPILEDSHGGAARALTHLMAAMEEGTLRPEGARKDILVVLDDLHCIQSPDAAAVVRAMIENGPASLHFLLLSRGHTEVSLARLFAHEAVLVLNVEDLRFSAEEIRCFVTTSGFAEPTRSELEQLVRRSEGWIMALQMAVLAVRKHGSVVNLLGALHAGNGWLAEFLAGEVLQQQPARLRSFLLQTSILDQFNGALCAAVTRADDAFATLAAVANAGLFLIPLEGGDGWYRYHHLFQELLQRQLLAETDLPEVADLHCAAASWLADEGHVTAAVHHLLLASAENDAACLIERHLPYTLLNDPPAARHLLGLLPMRIMEQRPRLMLDRALQAILMSSYEAPAFVRQAGQVLEQQQLTLENAPEVNVQWLLFRSCVAFTERDLIKAWEYLVLVQSYEHLLSDTLRGLMYFLQVHLMRYEGRHVEMQRCAAAALAAFTRAGFDYGRVALQRELANWSMRSGHSLEAARQFDAIFSSLPLEQPLIMRELVFAYFYAADNSYWRNRLGQSRAYQETGLALARQLGDEELILYATVLARLLDVAEGRASAELAAPTEQLQALTATGLWEMTLDLYTRLLVTGNQDRAGWNVDRLLGEAGRMLMGGAKLHELSGVISYARLYIALGVDLAALMQTVTEALAYRSTIGDRFSQLQLLVLKAWLHSKQQSRPIAVKTLGEAVTLAQETGYVRVLLDIPDIAKLLLEVTGSSPARSVRRSQGALAPDTPVELTDQECVILDLLAADYSYQQIADELVISLNTVRTHVRHIYRKLAVHRRERAIERARWLGLVANPTA